MNRIHTRIDEHDFDWFVCDCCGDTVDPMIVDESAHPHERHRYRPYTKCCAGYFMGHCADTGETVKLSVQRQMEIAELYERGK